MAKPPIILLCVAVMVLVASSSIAQLNVPKTAGMASIAMQANVPRRVEVPAAGETPGTFLVRAEWLTAQNETLLDSIRLLTSAVSAEEFRKYQEFERTETTGKDQSALLDHRNKYLHLLVKAAVKP